MRKLRLAFVGIALALVIPVALLVGRAMRSVAVERELRHKTVAERIFDEIERALSEILEREEARPAAQYDQLLMPTTLPFVHGYFEIDASGRVRMLEGAAATARALAERLAASLRAGGATANAPPPAVERQLPGTTVEVGRRELGDRRTQAPESDQVSAYDALRSLNKAVSQRAEGQKKARTAETVVAQAERAPALPGTKSAAVDARKDEAGAPRGAMELERKEAPSVAAAPPVDTTRTRLAAKEDARLAAAEEAAAATDSTDLDVELPPIESRIIDARHLLLYRTVLHDGRRHRQGLVIDVTELGEWLAARAIGADGLASVATLTFATTLSPHLPVAESDLTYEHRFAEPFADVSARLVLAPLPGVAGTGYVYTLSALLLVTLMLGLAALYRMVSVAVSFAERRSHFVATVSHELKTPLTAIRMYGEMLRDDMVASEDKRREYYRYITLESERLSRLLNNVLEFSRLEKGTRQVALVTGPLAPVVQEAAVLLTPHVQGEGFALDVDVGADLPQVRFERDALLQVIFNLVDNAVKYARDAASKRVTLACRRHAHGVQLSVRDGGGGVPARHLRRIFEPFFRGETELTRRSKGSGLGLALVRGLALRMGARVDGHNVPGGGFEVVIVFPPASVM